MTLRTHRLRRAMRWLAMMAAGMLLWWLGLDTIGMPPDLPFWRVTLGALLFSGAVALWLNA